MSDKKLDLFICLRNLEMAINKEQLSSLEGARRRTEEYLCDMYLYCIRARITEFFEAGSQETVHELLSFHSVQDGVGALKRYVERKGLVPEVGSDHHTGLNWLEHGLKSWWYSMEETRAIPGCNEPKFFNVRLSSDREGMVAFLPVSNVFVVGGCVCFFEFPR